MGRRNYWETGLVMRNVAQVRVAPYCNSSKIGRSRALASDCSFD